MRKNNDSKEDVKDLMDEEEFSFWDEDFFLPMDDEEDEPKENVKVKAKDSSKNDEKKIAKERIKRAFNQAPRANERRLHISPKEIKEKVLDAHIYGQEQAKRKAAIFVRDHSNGIKRSILFVGPSGCGKTEIFRVLRDKVYDNIYIYDASNITEEGWSGSKKVSSVFADMLQAGYTVEEIEHSIIVYDEFDKLCIAKHNSHGENVARGVQGELLSIIEGTKLSLKSGEVIDTSNISFAFLGAFEDLYTKERKKGMSLGFGSKVEETDKNESVELTMDDIISFGLRVELAGRISDVVNLDPLREDDFYRILADKTISPAKRFEAIYHMNIELSKDLMRKIALEAYNNKMGVRYLRSKIQSLLDDMLYERQQISEGDKIYLHE